MLVEVFVQPLGGTTTENAKKQRSRTQEVKWWQYQEINWKEHKNWKTL